MLGSSAGAMRTSCHPCVVSVRAGQSSGHGVNREETDLNDVHGERVKEFVCDEHGETVVATRNLVEGVVPRDRDAVVFVEGRALERAHGGARLDEMHAVEVGACRWELSDDLRVRVGG